MLYVVILYVVALYDEVLYSAVHLIQALLIQTSAYSPCLSPLYLHFTNS